MLVGNRMGESALDGETRVWIDAVLESYVDARINRESLN